MPRGFFKGIFAGLGLGGLFLAFLSILDQAPGDIPPEPVVQPAEMSRQGVADETEIDVALPDSRPAMDVSKTEVTGKLSDPILAPEVTDAGPAPSPEETDRAELASAPTAQENAIEDIPKSSSGSSLQVAKTTTRLSPPLPEQLPTPQFLAEEPSTESVEDTQVELTQDDPQNDVAPVQEPDENLDQVSIGAPEQKEESTVETASEAMTLIEPELVETLPAIEANAIPFDADELKNTVSFVILDDPESQVPVDVLANLPFPITVAVNAKDEDAAAWSDRLFDAGIEVAVFGDAPQDAPAGKEDRYFAYVDAVPKAVAVVGGNALGLRSSPAKGSRGTCHWSPVTGSPT